VQADQRICYMIEATKSTNQPCGCVLHLLKTTYQLHRKTYQHAVSVVKSGQHQSNHQLLEYGRRHRVADLTQLTERSEASRYCSLNMQPHYSIRIDEDAQVPDGCNQRDLDAVNRQCSGWKLMLPSTCCTPEDLSFV